MMENVRSTVIDDLPHGALLRGAAAYSGRLSWRQSDCNGRHDAGIKKGTARFPAHGSEYHRRVFWVFEFSLKVGGTTMTLGYERNIPIVSLRKAISTFVRVGFTEVELGVRFIRDGRGNVTAFSHDERLAECGPQLNVTAVPLSRIPAKPTLDDAARVVAADEFIEAWVQKHGDLLRSGVPEHIANDIAKIQASEVMKGIGEALRKRASG
jgi:hypothetical protein